jgi:drug/metabolite transporter (DMT)-like permease
MPALSAERLRAAGPAAQLVVSAILFAVMATAAKQVSRGLGGAEVVVLRSAFGVVACALVHAFVRRLVARNKLGLAARGLSGAVAVYAYFLAIEHLPVGIAALLNYTAPVFTAIWSVIFLHERLARRAYAALLLTSCGLAAVIHGQAPPGMLGFGRWELVGMCGAMFSGLSMVFIAELRKTDGAWEIFGVFSVVCLIVAGPGAIAVWRWPGSRLWLAILVMGTSSVMAQITMTFAMRRVSATLAGIVNQLTPAVSLLLGAVFYGERFGTLTSCGIAIVLVGGATGAALTGTGRSLFGLAGATPEIVNEA